MLDARMENLKPLADSSEIHDRLLGEASDLESEINELRKQLEANRHKKFLTGDNVKEKEIDDEFNDISGRLAALETELRGKWVEINKVQGELLEEKTE